MFNMINKSVKSINSGISNIVSGITGENSYKTEVDFCKFDVLNLNFLKNTEKEALSSNIASLNLNQSNRNDTDQNFKEFKVFYVVYSKINLNIYLITEELELKCIFSQKMNFIINSVDTLFLPINTTYYKELPIIAFISSSSSNSPTADNTSNILNPELINGSTILVKCESHLKLFSLKSKRIVHNFRFKKKILQVVSKSNFFAVGFADGSIKLYENEKMNNFWTINPLNSDGLCKDKIGDKIKSNPCNTLNRQNKNISNFNNVSSATNNTTITNANSLTHTLLSSSLSNNFNLKQTASINTGNAQDDSYVYFNPVFDISETYIVYYNNCNKESELKLKKENSANLIQRKDNLKEKDLFIANNHNYNSFKYNPSENLKINAKTNNIINDASINNKRILNNSNSNSKNSSEKSFRKVTKFNTNNNLKIIKNDLGIKSTKTFSPLRETQGSSNNSEFENVSAEVYSNISKLKDWSVGQIKDLYNLRMATNLKNNKEVKSGKKDESTSNPSNIFSCSITLQKIIFDDDIHLKLGEERESREGNCYNKHKNNMPNNHQKDFSDDFDFFSNYLDKIKNNSTKIIIPFFQDGISTLKFLNNGRNIIVGNKNSQMFFIYELYPQSNLKFTNDIDSPNLNQIVTTSLFNIKINYSVYRGITAANINALAQSSCKNFLTLASNKGTFHIFDLPKRDNQLIENTLNFDYKNFDLLNQKVTCARDFEKIKYKNFLYNYTYKSACMLMNLQRIDVDRNFTTEMKENLLKSKFNKSVKGNVLCSFAENDSAIYFYFLNKASNNSKALKPSNPVYLMKRYEILTTEDKEEAERNYELITKGRLLNNASFSKSKTYYKENIEMDTTEKNFTILHKNPFFTFNVIKTNHNSNKNSGNKTKPKIPLSTNPSLNSNKILTNKNAVIEEKSESEFSPSSSLDSKSNKRFLINKLMKHNALSICPVWTFTLSSQSNNAFKPSSSRRSNSIHVRFNSNMNILSNYYGNVKGELYSNASNEINIYEKIICGEFEYTPKGFNPDKKINLKNDFINENYLQPKLIVYPNNFNMNHKLRRSIKTNSRNAGNNSNSDNSSVNNSLSVNGVNLNTEQNSLFENEYSSNNGFGFNPNTFYKNKESLLENQLRNAIETSINDSLNKKNEVVKLVGEFKIDENYYVMK